MVCALDTRCVGRFELLINDKPRSVLIVAAVSSGYAFVGFFDGPAPLFVRGQAYVSIPLGYPYTPRHLTVGISEPLPDDLEDGPLRRRPVARAPADVLATVDIDIRPSD